MLDLLHQSQLNLHYYGTSTYAEPDVKAVRERQKYLAAVFCLGAMNLYLRYLQLHHSHHH